MSAPFPPMQEVWPLRGAGGTVGGGREPGVVRLLLVEEELDGGVHVPRAEARAGLEEVDDQVEELRPQKPVDVPAPQHLWRTQEGGGGLGRGWKKGGLKP